ncbi:PAS domain-containing protein [Maribius pontilimi]|uniref:PAS domain-containing protein n=1 Tax=Palleronia pontilimi TaxID=1964209 RepID=A0A934IGE2_9RHOB|nr:PAS domain-containing protein [Palleronia pontilimi]MBJ3762940.1 PAS domain-containing protein [Palleronia pontilimi]
MFGYTPDHGKDDKIVALNSRRPKADGIDCFHALETYWTALSAGRIMPYRDEVDPRGLEQTLDQTFLLERIAPGMARFRLAGQQVSSLLGMDLRGMPFSALFTPGARDELKDSLSAIFDEPARVELVLQSRRQGLRGRLAARMLLLPLRDRAGEVSRVIGCMSAGGKDVRAPQRFDLVGQDRRTLLGYGSRPDFGPATPGPDFTAADAARDRLRDRDRMRGKLTVISNDA